MCRRPDKGTFDLAGLLPDSVLGWAPSGEDSTYDPDTIFDYIDGAGEVHRAYGFKTLLGRRYSREGSPDIIADLFDMGEARGAFGVFTHDLEGEDAGIGQASVYKGGLLSFWKGRVFASIFAEEETPEAEEAVKELGKAVVESIPEEGEIPSLVSLFPTENRVPRSIRYFFNHLILNYHFFVADENILHLDPTTEAALALYTLDGRRSRLLLVRYADEDKAQAAAGAFLEAYMPDAVSPGAVHTEDGTWTVVRTEGPLLAVVFEAPTREAAESLIDVFHP